jgi:hypothetical protein
MAEDLHVEFRQFDDAVADCDSIVHRTWESQYTAWVSGDRSGSCPFEAEDALKRKLLFTMCSLRCVNNVTEITSADVKRLLAKESLIENTLRNPSNSAEDGGDSVVDATPASILGYVLQALRLEALQYVRLLEYSFRT